MPVSAASTRDGGVGGAVSSVNEKLVVGDVFPATLVCRTCTLLVPSVPKTDAEIEVPVPFIQLVPPLTLYCQAAPEERLDTFIWPLLVMPSLELLPVSEARASAGAAAEESSVKEKAV